MTPPYWQKQFQPLWLENLRWNVPEQPLGQALVVGGNSGIFSGTIKIAEYLSAHFPIKELRILLPEALERQLPPLPGLTFAPSTPSGSFAKIPAIPTDATLIYGELSKNATTASALADYLKTTTTPVFVGRDAVDLLTATNLDFLASASNLALVASAAQFQKLLRSLYYPKVLYLSMPLAQVVELLHKFTLSYPLLVLTFHADQILIARAGQVISTPIKNTKYTPLGLWQGELIATALGLTLYNPGRPLENLASAIF